MLWDQQTPGVRRLLPSATGKPLMSGESVVKHAVARDGREPEERHVKLQAGVPEAKESVANAGVNVPVVPPVSREMDIAVNPYAGSLRNPGKSKRAWDAGYIRSFQQEKTGDPVGFELTGGVMAAGTVKIIQIQDGAVVYVAGELTAPETGKFFFLTPSAGGKAGKAVGVVEFPATRTAYRVEPTGTNGDPELWQRRQDEVICMDMEEVDPAKLQAAQEVDGETGSIAPLRPDLVANYVPSYNANIVSLQSYPGSPAVLLLDFAGGYTGSWGGVTYARPNASNDTIKDVWKRVAEDYMPFNINVTTDIKVFQAAPAASRQRCCFTTTPITAAGVAYFGSWNWGNDTVCWSVYCAGKPAAEVGAHEPGHTLGLAHQTQDFPDGGHNEYYGGQGGGQTGWAPIMGVGYYQPLSTWSKGGYQYAGQKQDELQTIATANNNVHYRTDDTGDTLATSRYLEVYANNTVFAEGVIERTDDTDAFQFTTTGGAVSLTVNPVAVGDWSDLATMAALADATDTVIATNNAPDQVSSTITATLPAGTYTFRVTGVGKNDPLTNGFSSYASLGYYSISGSVAGARQPTRMSVAEHAPTNTLVGSVPAVNPNSSPLVYAIASGNTGATFSVDNAGAVRVANNTLLDYYTLAANTAMYGVRFEVFMNITNVNNPALTETNRRVVIAVQQLYAPVPSDLTATLDSSLRIDLAWIESYGATGYNVKRSTAHGGPYTTVANPTTSSYADGNLTNGVTYYYVVSAVDANGESHNSSEASALALSVAGGFESPPLGSGNFQYSPAGGGGWTFNNSAGIVANGSGFSNPDAPEGVQAAFVQEFGTITQTFAGFTPGTLYTITYAAAQRGSQTGESWDVVIDGNVIKSNTPGSTSYTGYTAAFIATAATHTLSFVGTDLAGGDNTVFIDNVSLCLLSPLQPVVAAVVVTSPANDTVFGTYAPVSLTASVTTNGNLINGVQFYVDNAMIGQVANAPYICAWANSSAGSHSMLARVLFNKGSFADSTPVNIVVANADANSTSPILTANTLPATAADVVGGEVTFTAAFTGVGPITYQWQRIVSGQETDVAGANSPKLTLSNLQLGDTGYYRLQALNPFGASVSTAVPLTVTNVPAAVANVITCHAAQTGLGSASGNFSPTWTVAPGSLIAGKTPSTVGSGNFEQSIAVLTDGVFGRLTYGTGAPTVTQVTCGNAYGAGQSITYTLGASANGYTLSKIVVYGGWCDAGRDQQAYTVYYSTVANPTAFTLLASVNYNPANPNAVQSATRATLSSSTADPLASNVAALKFDFTTPTSENGYCGYSEIAVYGTSLEPAITMNTLPATAADVVGGQVTFTAGITGTAPLSYQWRKVRNGVTSNVAGATNATLTLTNLQAADTASYQLQASNAYGVAVSSPSTLKVNSVPAAVNNVVASMAAQTGLGGYTNFLPSWPFDTRNSLIAGMEPTSSAGDFSLNTAGATVNSLTAGDSLTISPTSGGDSGPNYLSCGNAYGSGSSVVYTLPVSASGYGLTNITVYGGWRDAGRDQQAYTVSYSKVATPTTFVTLGTVNYNPVNPAAVQSATRATLTPANGVLATNVAAVKFDFTTPASENGWVGYSEIAVYGMPAPVAPTGLTATAGDTQVSLSWTAASGAASYNVKRATVSGGPYTTVASPSGTSYPNTGLTNGTIYYYVVSAVNAGGESGSSGQVSATPVLPGYQAWLAAYPALTGADRAPDADPDRDGVPNGIEFLTGTSPVDPSGPAPMTAAVDVAGNMVLHFKRVDAAKAYTVAIETSPNLWGPWTSFVVTNDAIIGPPLTIVANGAAADDITLTMPSAGVPRKFARLRITIPVIP